MTLRITRGEGAIYGGTLLLEGRIAGEWASLLEQVCASLLREPRAVALDLSKVTFVDRNGVEALARLDRAGVEIGGCSEAVGSVLQAEGIHISGAR